MVDRLWNGREYTVIGYCCYVKNNFTMFREFKSDSPEEAAAQALIRILGEASHD